MRRERGDLLKGTSTALPIDEIRIRKVHCVPERPIVDCNHDQPIRLAVRKRRQQHAVQHAEGGGVCANAQRQREDHRRREAGAFAQRAGGIANLAEEAVERFERLMLPAFLLCQTYRAEFAASPQLRILPAKPLLNVIADLVVQMELKLGVHSPLPAPSFQPVAQAHPIPHSPVSSTSQIASQRRFQPAVSASSW